MKLAFPETADAQKAVIGAPLETSARSHLEDMFDQMLVADDPQAQVQFAEGALSLLYQEKNPHLWACLRAIQSAALMRANSDKLTEPLLRRIVEGYVAALAVFDPVATPELWRETQRNLAASHYAAIANNIGNRRTHVEAAMKAELLGS